MSIPFSFFKQRSVSVNYVIMKKLYSPDKMVEISIFSFESQFAKNDGSKVVRHSTVAAIMRSPYAPY